MIHRPRSELIYQDFRIFTGKRQVCLALAPDLIRLRFAVMVQQVEICTDNSRNDIAIFIDAAACIFPDFKFAHTLSKTIPLYISLTSKRK